MIPQTLGACRPRLGCGAFATSILIASYSVAGAQTLTNNVYGGPGQASAYGDPSSPDARFVADGGSSKESFGIEGNVNLSGQELRINALTGSAPGSFTFGVEKNSGFEWVSGRTYGFTQSYSGDATKQLVFTINDAFTGKDYSVSRTVEYGNVGMLMIRERTPQGSDVKSSSILFSGLKVNGNALGADVSLDSGTDYDRASYAIISGVDFTDAWTFSGDVSMTWSGFEPNANKLNFQIKGIQKDFTFTPVPEPASALLAALGLSLTFLRRKR